MDNGTKVWFDTDAAATYTSSRRNEIREAAESGELRGYQRVRRGKWRFHREDLDAWVRGEAPAARPGKLVAA